MNTPMTSFAPGTAFQYGGVSMHVAGRLAEITTGMTWDSLFQQKIAIPLGMTNTDYEALGETMNYRIAGGMGTTMPDFSKLLIMLLNDGLFNGVQVIEPETVSMMQSDQTNGVPLISTPYSNDPLRQDFRYGYGVWVEKSMYGRKYMGMARTTFIIDENGIITDIIEKVDTKAHTKQILK